MRFPKWNLKRSIGTGIIALLLMTPLYLAHKSNAVHHATSLTTTAHASSDIVTNGASDANDNVYYNDPDNYYQAPQRNNYSDWNDNYYSNDDYDWNNDQPYYYRNWNNWYDWNNDNAYPDASQNYYYTPYQYSDSNYDNDYNNWNWNRWNSDYDNYYPEDNYLNSDLGYENNPDTWNDYTNYDPNYNWNNDFYDPEDANTDYYLATSTDPDNDFNYNYNPDWNQWYSDYGNYYPEDNYLNPDLGYENNPDTWNYYTNYDPNYNWNNDYYDPEANGYNWSDNAWDNYYPGYYNWNWDDYDYMEPSYGNWNRTSPYYYSDWDPYAYDETDDFYPNNDGNEDNLTGNVDYYLATSTDPDNNNDYSNLNSLYNWDNDGRWNDDYFPTYDWNWNNWDHYNDDWGNYYHPDWNNWQYNYQPDWYNDWNDNYWPDWYNNDWYNNDWDYNLNNDPYDPYYWDAEDYYNAPSYSNWNHPYYYSDQDPDVYDDSTDDFYPDNNGNEDNLTGNVDYYLATSTDPDDDAAYYDNNGNNYSDFDNDWNLYQNQDPYYYWNYYDYPDDWDYTDNGWNDSFTNPYWFDWNENDPEAYDWTGNWNPSYSDWDDSFYNGYNSDPDDYYYDNYNPYAYYDADGNNVDYYLAASTDPDNENDNDFFNDNNDFFSDAQPFYIGNDLSDGGFDSDYEPQFANSDYDWENDLYNQDNFNEPDYSDGDFYSDFEHLYPNDYPASDFAWHTGYYNPNLNSDASDGYVNAPSDQPDDAWINRFNQNASDNWYRNNYSDNWEPNLDRYPYGSPEPNSVPESDTGFNDNGQLYNSDYSDVNNNPTQTGIVSHHHNLDINNLLDLFNNKLANQNGKANPNLDNNPNAGFDLRNGNKGNITDNNVTDNSGANDDTATYDGGNQSGISANQQQNTTDMKNATLTDINTARNKINGASALNEDPNLDKIAAQRAQQAASDFSHYDENNGGKAFYQEDAAKLGVNLGGDNGENIAQNTIGYAMLGDTDYNNKNGSDMAYSDNDAMLNHDYVDGNNGGHRKNILDKNYTKVGLGTYYDPSTSRYLLAEVFSN